MKQYKPVVLIILDGFGISPDQIGSPWETAKHPTFSDIEKNYPFTALQASGIAVGLPWGKEGNSEVGHLAIGSGKIIYNHLPRISTAISDETFFSNEVFLKAANHVKQNNSSLHLMGLFSSGTVHSYSEHLYALMDFTTKQNISNVFLHLFSDGKDAYYKEGFKFFKELEDRLKSNYPNIKIASIIGRKYSMDRDNNWGLTEKAYKLFTESAGEEINSASSHIMNNYEKENYDSSISPAFISNTKRITDNDSVIFYNFREDSPRQLAQAFVEDNFNKFERIKLNNLFFVTMTEYSKNIPTIPAFHSTGVKNPLAKIISDNKLKQFHIAETVKYAHITYFLNGGNESKHEGEDWLLVPSLETPSFEISPEMSAEKITEEIIYNLDKYNFIVANFANADMVGHTGNFKATSKALEKLDKSISVIIPEVLKTGGAVVITADHGNAEEKTYKLTGEKKTEHSINPVPFYVISNEFKNTQPATQEEIKKKYQDTKGTLADVAPTVLDLLGLKPSEEMSGQSLLKNFPYYEPKISILKKLKFWEK